MTKPSDAHRAAAREIRGLIRAPLNAGCITEAEITAILARHGDDQTRIDYDRGFSHATGQWAERIAELELQLGHQHDASPTGYDEGCPCQLCAAQRDNERLREAAREAEMLLVNYLANGHFPPGSDCDVVATALRAALDATKESE